VRPNSLDDTPQLHIDIDQDKANALGVATADVNATLSAAWGGTFINNFIDRGRVKRVYLQGDAPYPHDAAGSGPLVCAHQHRHHGALLLLRHARWTIGPATLTRYNGLPRSKSGRPAPGVSSGTAMNEMAKLFAQLPKGIGYELTGLSYQEAASGGAGAGPLCPVDFHHLSVPGGAV
jgi:multidrug efflux pump